LRASGRLAAKRTHHGLAGLTRHGRLRRGSLRLRRARRDLRGLLELLKLRHPGFLRQILVVLLLCGSLLLLVLVELLERRLLLELGDLVLLVSLVGYVLDALTYTGEGCGNWEGHRLPRHVLEAASAALEHLHQSLHDLRWKLAAAHVLPGSGRSLHLGHDLTRAVHRGALLRLALALTLTLTHLLDTRHQRLHHLLRVLLPVLLPLLLLLRGRRHLRGLLMGRHRHMAGRRAASRAGDRAGMVSVERGRVGVVGQPLRSRPARHVATEHRRAILLHQLRRHTLQLLR